MLVPTTLKYGDKGEDDEGKGNEGEQDVTGQHREVNRRQPPAVTGRFFTYLGVISEIANEKQGRGNERRDHANDVALPEIPPNEVPAR